jgi:hypothetical protein
LSRSVPRVPAAALALAALLAASPARGGPLAAKEEATVRELFPGADRVTVKDLLLTDELAKRIERLARARVKERLVTFYTAHRADEVVGHAVIHSHVVRTKRETLALGFEPDGRIRKITVLAFHEPPEYRPSDRWLARFEGKGTDDRLAVGHDIPNITGATLTARGVSEESRWLLHALREAKGLRAEARP